MPTILHITGLSKSKKFGGIERWYVKYAEMINNQSENRIILFYNQESPLPSVNDAFKKRNIESFVFPFNFSLENARIFIRFLKDNKVDIVHGHFENTLWFLIIAKFFGIKTYWHLLMGNFYAVDNEWKKSLKLIVGTNFHRIKFFLAQFFINKIYCASFGVLKEYKTFYFFLSSKLEVNYLGLTKNQLEKNTELKKTKSNSDDTKLNIGCIAFHAPIKGVDILIRALGILKSRGYDFNLIQIGGGQFLEHNNDSQSLYDLAKDQGIENNVTWMGIQQNVFEYLVNFDIYCQPSRHEALSFSIMEAMCVGLPIVATNTCGIPEIVKHNQNGFLFEPNDYIGCADQLEKLILDKQMREKMSLQSKVIINNPIFYTETNIENILNNYKNLK